QEVVFIQRVIGLTETDYSFLISITGVGSITGAILLTIFSKSLSLRYMLSIGLFMVTVGYMIYAFSWSFTSVSIGFIILGFFNALSMTFFQNNFPVNVMGRVTSIFQLIQSVGQITFILSIGIIADLVSVASNNSCISITYVWSVYNVFNCNIKRKQKRILPRREQRLNNQWIYC